MSAAAAARRAALRAAFGSSDSDVGGSSSGADDCESSDAEAAAVSAPVLERHVVVEGLSLLRGFLSARAQAALLAAVRAQGWAPPDGSAARNQALHFGYDSLPAFARSLADDVATAAAAHALLPPPLLARAPAFNQLICNAYAPGAPSPFRSPRASGRARTHAGRHPETCGTFECAAPLRCCAVTRCSVRPRHHAARGPGCFRRRRGRRVAGRGGGHGLAARQRSNASFGG
jgi:hypothetical protein